MSNQLDRFLPASTLVACFCLGSSVASAQAPDQPSPDDAAASEESALGEVVVTAQRRTERLQDVPIAATVISADELATKGISSVDDLARAVPTLSITKNNRSTILNIRGVGLSVVGPQSSPGVAVYINGEFVPRDSSLGFSFYDLASVEVLRGPQGTLTGQNSTAGAIYIRTPAPTFDDVHGYVEIEAGEYDKREFTGAVNIPFSSTLAMRVAATHDERDSFTTNVGNDHSQPGNVNFTGARAELRWQPNADLDMRLRGEWFDTDNDFIAVKPRNAANPDPYVISEDAIARSVNRGYRTSLELNYQLSENYGLRWQSALGKIDLFDISDGDRGTAPPRPPASNTGRLGYVEAEFDLEVHEVNLLYDNSADLRWILGAFYYEEDSVPTILQRYHFSTVVRDTPPTSTNEFNIFNESWSVFGQADWVFTDGFSLTAGARYSESEQLFDVIAPPTGTSLSKETVWTGKVALNWKPAEDALVYASVSKGFKAGGNNLVDVPFGPETNTQQEIGAKLELLDQRLRVNAAAFLMQYDDFQISTLSPAGFPTVRNLAEAETYGIEVEAQGRFGRFGFDGGIAWLTAESKVDSLQLDGSQTPSVLLPVPAGTRLPFAPEWTINAGAEYAIPLPGGELIPRIQVSHVSDQYIAVFQNPNTIVPSRTLFDARLTYESANGWSIAAFVENLDDEVYLISQMNNTSSADGGYIYGAPRHWGLRAKVNF